MITKTLLIINIILLLNCPDKSCDYTWKREVKTNFRITTLYLSFKTFAAYILHVLNIRTRNPVFKLVSYFSRLVTHGFLSFLLQILLFSLRIHFVLNNVVFENVAISKCHAKPSHFGVDFRTSTWPSHSSVTSESYRYKKMW